MSANLIAIVLKGRGRKAVGQREAPSKEAMDRLLEVIKPGAPDNPWDDFGLQVRNQLLVHMSQLDIAKWSGRKNARQNQAYDHMAPEEFLSMARELTEGDDRLFGGLADLMSKTPVSRDEFMMLVFPTAQTTELGFCIHDFAMLPCERNCDCMNCNEHVCVKGDKSKTARIKEQLELAEAQLWKAEEAVAGGYYGANRWQEHHQATVGRLRNLTSILEDSTVPEGSLIRLTKQNEFSPIRLAIQDRKLLEGPGSSTSNDLRAMPGGE